MSAGVTFNLDFSTGSTNIEQSEIATVTEVSADQTESINIDEVSFL